MLKDQRKGTGRKRGPSGKLDSGKWKAVGNLIEIPKRNTIIKDRLIETAGALSESDGAPEITYQHSILCQTALPYRNPGAGVTRWKRVQGKASLSIQALTVDDPETGEPVELGLPWGPKARLVLMHLNQEAVRTQSPVIGVGDSLTAFVKRIGLTTDGRTIRSIKEQVGALSNSIIQMVVPGEDVPNVGYVQVVSGFDLWLAKDERQRVLWPSKVELSEKYYNSLAQHAVPLEERAVGALSHSAMALDIYTWLAHRLHRIRKPHRQFIPWPAVQEQFGSDYARLRKFREVFMEALRQVHAVYRHAKIDVTGHGLFLYTSPPPVAKTSVLVKLPGPGSS